VKAFAIQRGIPLVQPATLNAAEVGEVLRAARAQVMVVAAYGLILPQSVLDLFPLGCINIHASLLPRWRGAAPIQRAILAGDRDSGITIMRMEAGLDTGPIYLAHRLHIEPEDNAGSLHDKLAMIGGSCIVEVLATVEAGAIEAVPQPSVGVTYAHKIDKQEASIDWLRGADDIARQVRAFNPFPVANTTLRGEALRIWRAHAVQLEDGIPGSVVEATDTGILVACGRGALVVQELQRAGAERLPAADFLRGVSLAVGDRFGG
jgi:methionyl-tRNA formyltransferase